MLYTFQSFAVIHCIFLKHHDQRQFSWEIPSSVGHLYLQTSTGSSHGCRKEAGLCRGNPVSHTLWHPALLFNLQRSTYAFSDRDQSPQWLLTGKSYQFLRFPSCLHSPVCSSLLRFIWDTNLWRKVTYYLYFSSL